MNKFQVISCNERGKFSLFISIEKKILTHCSKEKYFVHVVNIYFDGINFKFSIFFSLLFSSERRAVEGKTPILSPVPPSNSARPNPAPRRGLVGRRSRNPCQDGAGRTFYAPTRRLWSGKLRSLDQKISLLPQLLLVIFFRPATYVQQKFIKVYIYAFAFSIFKTK